MDMTQYAGKESNYLKAADLKGRRIQVTIESVGILEFEDEEKGTITKPALRLVGKEKQVVCNPTSVQELNSAFGSESDQWIGKEIVLSTKHYPKLGKDGIVITPVVEAELNDDVPF